MLICQHNAEFAQITGKEEDFDWSLAAKEYPDLREMPSFIAQQRQEFVVQSFTTSADPSYLQGKQLLAYSAVREHSESSNPSQSLSGTAGTGKSYLIQCLKLLLKDRLCVAAPTGVAAFNVDGYTLHSLLSLPVKGDFKPLEGKRLHNMQETLASVEYIIIDEMSMVGRKMFGQVDRRLRQVYPNQSEELFGGRSCLLIGDWGQLPPVMDLPLYIEAVAEHNVAKLCASGHPVAVLRAIHTGPGASKASTDDAGGLEPVVFIAHGARVMLSANLWVEVGLVNGALGTVEAIC